MAGKTVFMFSGQGAQYYQMGRQLYDEHPGFRLWMRRLDGLAQALGSAEVLTALYASPKEVVFEETALTHPAIFMVEYALAQCLLESGLRSDLVLGASLGSFAAAAVGGYLTVEEAMAGVLRQAAAFAAGCAPGGMIAVLGAPALYETEEFLHRHGELAAVNFDGHFVVAAPEAALTGIEAGLQRCALTFQRLPVGYAYHSTHIEGARAPFASWLDTLGRRSGAVPLGCCAQAATLDELPADFLWRVVRAPIRFADTVAHLERQGPHRYIDVGPSGTLATFVKYALPPGSASSVHAVLTPYGRDAPNLAALLAATS